MFCREVLLCEPFKFKVRSTERKQAWDTIAANLNKIQDPKFRVNSRSVRDRYTSLTDGKSAQLKDQKKASGINVVETELDVLLEEILEKENEAQLQMDDKKQQERKKVENDKLSAQDIRQIAMERMSKKNESDDDSTPKKKKTRRGSQELFQFFEEKVSKTYAYKQEKLEAKMKEQEASDKREKERNERLDKIIQQQNDNMMAMMQQQQQHLQQIQVMFMAQQQQQTQAFKALLGKGGNK